MAQTIETPPSIITRTVLAKAAFDNGWRFELPDEGGWIARRSTTAKGQIWLAAAGLHGPWFVALDRADVAAQLDAPPADLPGPGVARFVVDDRDDLHALVRRIYELARALPPEPIETYRRRLERAPPDTTEALYEVHQRVGQEVFREALMDLWGGRCPMTGITDPELLRASHMKPWADCASDAERLDPFNGLLLSALWDAAFDRGLVTFTEEGRAVFSSRLSAPARARLEADAARPLPLRREHLPWLAWHREKVFQH